MNRKYIYCSRKAGGYVSDKKQTLICYQIMHMERLVAEVTTLGKVRIFESEFLPYDLYLEEEEDLDTCINNLSNFYYWCASRMLPLDRKYAKDILNSIGMVQAVTDRIGRRLPCLIIAFRLQMYTG